MHLRVSSGLTATRVTLVCALLTCFVSPPAVESASTHYVDAGNASPSSPYTSWATAATSIQDAADVAEAGSTVLIADGIFDTGSRVTPTTDGLLQCRVVVTNAITIQSLNGPYLTQIVGAEATGGGNGADAIRCIYLAGGAVLRGVMLTNGHTHVKGDLLGDVTVNHRGGGAYAPGGLLTHCVITGNGADQGGAGVAYAECRNCLLIQNRAGANGGGQYGGSLLNCTVADNEAQWYGAGVYNCSATNSIIYHNKGYDGNHWNTGSDPGVAVFFRHVCAPNVLAPGCFGEDPRFIDRSAGSYRVLPDSPCVDAGNSALLVGSTDLDDSPRIQDAAVDIGAYETATPEYWLSAEPPSLAIETLFRVSPADRTFELRNVGDLPLAYTITAYAPWLSSTPDSGSSTGQANTVTLSFDVSALSPGTYKGVILVVAGEADNSPLRVPVTLTVASITHFVDLDSPAPRWPYTNWTTAATTIQHAVDAAWDGDRVVVADGIYATGGRTYLGSTITNRVRITRDITVESVNGAAHTFISGSESTRGWHGSDAVRPVLMTDGVLSGFTITNGHTERVQNSTFDRAGGGVCVPNTETPLIRDCIIKNNAAHGSGGGTHYGRYERCVIAHNTAGTYGGGAYYGSLHNCLVHHNSSWWGGGTAESEVRNCTITMNAASSQTGRGGGTFGGSARNSIVYHNTSASDPNWSGNYLNFKYLCTTDVIDLGEQSCVTNPPSFVDRAGEDYHLADDSPCIDRGKDSYAVGTTDIEGNDRIGGDGVDIGAYEHGPPPGPAIPAGWWVRYGLSDTNSSSGDTDGDGLDNYREYVADTDPDDLTSYFPDVRVTATEADTCVLTIDPCSSIRLYHVLWRAGLRDGTPWQPIGPGRMGNGSRLQIPVTHGAADGYYRTSVSIP